MIDRPWLAQMKPAPVPSTPANRMTSLYVGPVVLATKLTYRVPLKWPGVPVTCSLIEPALGVTPSTLPNTTPLRRFGVTDLESAVHCENENGRIASILLAAITPRASCSSRNVDLCAASQFVSASTPPRYWLLKKLYEPDWVCGAYFLITPAPPPTWLQLPKIGRWVVASHV